MVENMELSQAAQEAPKTPRFRSQWNGPHKNPGQVFTKPSCTVPDQSMTIPEIIAKYTRTGLVPQSFAKRDEGGNSAFDPGFDPLDEGMAILEDARREAVAATQAAPDPAETESSPAPAPAGA